MEMERERERQPGAVLRERDRERQQELQLLRKKNHELALQTKKLEEKVRSLEKVTPFLASVLAFVLHLLQLSEASISSRKQLTGCLCFCFGRTFRPDRAVMMHDTQ